MMPPVKDWFLGFVESDSAWWHWLLEPGYAHCFAFGFSPGKDGEPGRWLVFDPSFNGLQVRLASEAEVEMWFARANRGHMTLLRMRVQGHPVVRPRWLVSCAGAVAALVGMRETPLTPWRLACIARRHGAVEVKS